VVWARTLVFVGIGLWAAPSTLSAATLTLPGKEPVTIDADRLEHLPTEDLYRGDGSVVIRRGTMRLTANRVRFNAKT
jgi:lipopolysaccharide export system protein LptA